MPTTKTCPKCTYVNPPDNRFCTRCGQSLSGVAAVTMAEPAPPPNRAADVVQSRWSRRPGELAARITSASFGGGSHAEIIIEEGLAALAVRNGQVVDNLRPGPYPVETLRSKWFGRGQDTVVYLVDANEQHISFSIDGLWSADPLRLKAECELAVRVTNVERFCRTLVKEQPTYTVADLQSYLLPEVRDAAQAYLADNTMQQLEATFASRRDDFAVDVGERLRSQLVQAGLEFVRVRFFDLRHPRLDQIKQQEEDLYLGAVELENHKRLFAVFSEEQLHEISKEEAEVARFELRAQVWERMRRAVQQDRISEATSAEEWATFVAAADRRKLVSEDDLARFREDLRWKSEDRNNERAHTVAMATVFAEAERERAGLTEKYKLDQTLLSNELTLLQQSVTGRLEIERQRIVLEQETASLQAARRREEAALDALAERQGMIDDALTQARVELTRNNSAAETARIRIQIERLEDDNDLLTAEKAQAMMRRNREDKLRIEREHWIALQKARLDEDERRQRMHMEEMRAEREHELARMDKLATMSAEALITLTDDQGRATLLAEIKKTEILKGFSEEQILAMAAERQPLIVDAIKARYQAASDGRLSAADAEKWKALSEAAERREAGSTSMMKEFLDRQERATREAAERQERLANTSMQGMGDVAKAFAQKPDGNPTIVFGPGGAQSYGGYGGGNPGASAPSQESANQVVVCPECQVRSAVGTKFCSNCGHKFFN